MLDKEGKPVAGRSAQLIGVDRPTDDDVIRAPTEAGAWFDVNSGDAAAIAHTAPQIPQLAVGDQEASEILQIGVGDTLFLPSADAKRSFKVVGICHKPAILAERVSWIY